MQGVGLVGVLSDEGLVDPLRLIEQVTLMTTQRRVQVVAHAAGPTRLVVRVDALLAPTSLGLDGFANPA
jgi:hypothetical protein